jgi:N-acetylmuramoyl-L-alanine amidase
MKRILCLAMAVTIAVSASADTVPLAALLEETNGTLEWNSLLQTGIIVCGDSRIVFSINAPWVIVNDTVKLPTTGITRRDGTIMFPRATAEAIKSAAAGNSAVTRTYRVGAIVIDPGHGGKDSGASYTHTVNGKRVRVSEKDVVLRMGKALFSLLKKRFPDKVVQITRSEDVTVALEDRPAVANAIPLKENEAIIYISLHANASLSRSARGFEVWYLTSTYRRNVLNHSSVESEYHEILPIMNSMQEEEFTRESILLARMIMAELNTAIGGQTENRGLKEGEWLVVRKAKMPSILIELGFVSNKEEALRLTTDAYLQKLTSAVYNGVCTFVDMFERTNAFTE